jgi:hypothetical protein
MSGHAGALLEACPYPAGELVHRLSAAGSDLGHQLQRSMDTPLRSYLRSLIPAAQDGPPPVHRLRLARAVERYLREHGDRRVDEVCEHLLRVPVIQQADHSNLLLDGETFLNNYLVHLATREAGGRVAITSQCSTMSGLSRRSPVLGPTFLRTRGALVRVVPMSKTALKDSSFCCLPGPVPMTFDVLEGELDVAADPVLGPFVGRPLDGGPRTYRRMNDEIWGALDLDHGVRRVQIDESVVSECVALHLADPSSPVTRLLFDPQARASFVRAKRRLVESPENLTVNRAAPDFFWYRKGARLREVVLDGDGFTIEAGGPPLPVPFEPKAIAEALRAGVLYADRVLAYLVRCLLPGVVAIGGVSQQDYLRLYRRMLLEADAETPILSAAERAVVRRPGLSRLGGRPLLEPTGDELQLIRMLGPATRLADLEDAFLDRPVGVTIGNLRCLGPNLTSRLVAAQPERYSCRPPASTWMKSAWTSSAPVAVST